VYTPSLIDVDPYKKRTLPEDGSVLFESENFSTYGKLFFGPKGLPRANVDFFSLSMRISPPAPPRDDKRRNEKGLL